MGKKKIIRRKRKVDVKGAAKAMLSEKFMEFLEAEGIEVSDNHEDFAFTGGTLVVHTEKCDVQVKFITPKAGLDRYQKVVYVDEMPEEEEVEEFTEEKLEKDMKESGEFPYDEDAE